MALSLGQIVAESYAWVLDRAPWQSNHLLLEMLEGHRSTYRERLDRQPTNFSGRTLSRREMVDWNLQRLGNIRMDPTRLR
jgi:hypothetical protein